MVPLVMETSGGAATAAVGFVGTGPVGDGVAAPGGGAVDVAGCAVARVDGTLADGWETAAGPLRTSANHAAGSQFASSPHRS